MEKIDKFMIEKFGDDAIKEEVKKVHDKLLFLRNAASKIYWGLTIGIPMFYFLIRKEVYPFDVVTSGSVALMLAYFLGMTLIRQKAIRIRRAHNAWVLKVAISAKETEDTTPKSNNYVSAEDFRNFEKELKDGPCGSLPERNKKIDILTVILLVIVGSLLFLFCPAPVLLTPLHSLFFVTFGYRAYSGIYEIIITS